MKTRLALAASIVLGIIAAIGLRVYMLKLKDEGPTDQPVAVLAAKRALPKGVPIGDPEAIETKLIPPDLVAGHIQEHQRTLLMGWRPIVNITRGEVLLWNYFISPRDITGEATDKLKEGERAVTLKVDQVSGVAGLILPGSRVDVLGTFVRQERGAPEQGTYTRPLLYNIPVLAIDNQTSLLTLRRDRRLQQGGYSSITVAVGPRAARLLTFAQSQGQISLMLRKPEDAGVEAETEIISLDNLDDIADELIDELRGPEDRELPAEAPAEEEVQ